MDYTNLRPNQDIDENGLVTAFTRKEFQPKGSG